MRFNTKLIHSGKTEDSLTGALTHPIYQTSTYSQESPGVPRRYQDRSLSYSRSENPSRTVLENALADLENAKYGLTFSSGIAAANNVLSVLKTGDHVIACRDLYGGSYRLFTKVYTQFGIEFSFVDTTDSEELTAAFKQNTRLLWLESPSNPLLTITDLREVCLIAKEHNAISMVDNTFATPYLQQPLALGADIVLHSTTKYINGHLDVIGGALVTNDDVLWERLKFYQNAVGAIPAPQDCFLIQRGLSTLALRMEKHCQNAKAVSEFLETDSRIEQVYYPGLTDHPGHEIAKEQMTGFGGMVSFKIKGDFQQAVTFLQSLEYFTLAESLGGVKSLSCHPASMTHASVEPEVREEVGIHDNLLRVSVGIEDAEDLIEDLDQALAKTFVNQPKLPSYNYN